VSALAIVLIVVGALLLILFLGGAVATARRRRELDARLRERVEAANAALAEAHAQDRGWDPQVLEQAAREALAARHPGVAIDELHLVQVVDRPGTEADEALFRAIAGGGEEMIRLGRRDGAWTPAPAQA
jgi:hypothetical protein